MPFNAASRYIRKASRNKMDPLFGGPARVMSLAKDVKMLKGIINSEKKFHDYSLSANLDTTGLKDGCTRIAQGQDNDNRIGRSILAKSLYIKGRVTFEDDTLTAQAVRMVIVQDRQQNGSIPDFTGDQDGVLQSKTFYSPLNMENSNRFKILFDRVFSFSKDSTRPVQHQYFKKWIKLNSHIHYSGTGSTAAEMDVNNLYILTFTDGNTTTTQSSMQGCIRLRYYDN